MIRSGELDINKPIDMHHQMREKRTDEQRISWLGGCQLLR